MAREERMMLRSLSRVERFAVGVLCKQARPSASKCTKNQVLF
jgi:hypothetical protein